MRVLTNFQAISEFWGFRDTCGPDAELVCRHSLSGDVLSGPAVDAIRADMVSHGLFAPGGCTMDQLWRENIIHSIATLYPQEWHYGADPETLHHALDQYAGLTDADGREYAFIFQVDDAGVLPWSEGGVRSHFVAIGGCDPSLGYLVANGDDVMALNINHGHGKLIPTRWMTWAQLLAAAPRALLALVGQGRPPMPYTILSDGRLEYRAGTLGQGFSALALAEHRTADLVMADTYYTANECFCLFADGTVYHYDKRTGLSRNGECATVVHGLADALAAKP